MTPQFSLPLAEDEPPYDRVGAVRAAQAIAALSDPVIAHADEPADQMRAEVLLGVELLYSDED